jgi:predicted dehydrogenase
MYRSTAAIAGSGFMGGAHLEALRRLGIPVTGVVCSSPEKAEKTAAEYGVAKAYADFDALLADDSVDAVHLCVPNHLHFDMASRALKAGKHVMCEKPLAMDSRESATLMALADSKALAAAVCYNLRYYPLNLQARDMVGRGDIGRLFHVNGCYIQDWLQHASDYNWRVDAKAGGPLRAIADIGTHWMDMVQMITGEKIARVFADLSTVHTTRIPAGKSPVEVDTEDCGSILFRMESGLHGSFFVSQVSSGRKNTSRYEIAGEKGALAWNSETPDALWLGHRDTANQTLLKDPSLLDGDAARASSYPGGHNEGYPDTFKQCFRAFYDHIDAGDFAAPAPFPTFADGHRELQLCEAILASHQTERWVDVGAS